MNRFEKAAIAATIVVTWYCAGLTASAWEIYVIWSNLSPQMTALAIIGWMIFSYGPIVVALLFWRWSKRVGWPWALHLLFLPSAWLVLVTGDWIMLYATQSWDWDSTIGAPVMTGMLMSLVAVFGYGTALLSRRWLGPEREAEAGHGEDP